jgi:uncharacterized phage protein (TIGR01671 family)
MREIEFRGKRIDTGEWVYGSLTVSKLGVLKTVVFEEAGYDESYGLRVNPDTVGQYTGLKDKDGVKIFEGDIVKSTSCMDETGFGDVYFDHGEWLIGFYGDEPGPLYRMQDYENGPTLEIISNIHDNPELVEETK